VSGSETPLVTVIVTAYNHERYVEQALISVVEQDTSFPFEVVVIEDCSTDNTREIVQALQARYPEKVRLVLSSENGSYNRLFATQWAASSAEYVATLDGDDFWTARKKLQRQVEILEARPEYSFCFHDVEVVAEGMSYVWEGRFTEGFGDGVRVRTLAWLDKAPDRVPMTPATPRRTLDAQALWAGCFVPGCSPLLRRSFLPTLPEGFGEIVFSDWALYLLLGQSGPIMYVDEVLGTYRVHNAGMWSGVPRENQHERVATFLERMLDLLPASEPVIRSQIERHLARAQVERRRSQRHRYLAEAVANPPDASALEAALTDHVPPESALIWVEPALRPAGLRRKLMCFPSPSDRSWQTFGSGAVGQTSAPWIAPGWAYEFRLEQHGDGESELSSLTVIADRAAPGPSVESNSSPRQNPPGEGAYLLADPNPGRAAGTHANTDVCWSTGNGSAGVVLVASYPLEEELPADDSDAVAALEQLRADGGEFMLVASACLGLLELYPGLEQHLSEHYRLLSLDPGLGRLYDLRS
jgi:Glycosyl transferase family 2